MTTKDCTAIEKIIKDTPNDQILGRKIQELAVKKMNLDYRWELFFKKTRGNAKTLGSKIRLISENGIHSNIISLLS